MNKNKMCTDNSFIIKNEIFHNIVNFDFMVKPVESGVLSIDIIVRL